MIARRSSLLRLALSAVALAACTVQDVSSRADSTIAAAVPRGGRAWSAETWKPPVVDSTPDDPLEASIYRGLALVTQTRDSLRAYVGGNLNCTSCHLDEGRRGNAAPLAGAFARFPKYLDRSGAVVSIEDRVNYCFTRSLAGSKLPTDSREMQDIVAYLAYISKGVPNGEHVHGEGLAKMPDAHRRLDAWARVVHRQLRALPRTRRRGHGACISRALGSEVVQHRRVDGATGTRRVVHQAQHAVRSARHAHRPTGVRHRGVRDLDAAP